MSKTFTKDDVAAHKSKDDLYIIVDEDVYDLTKFQNEHPGGQKSMAPRTILDYRCILTSYPSPHPSRWQRCVKAILEIPQREHSQEIQGLAPGWLIRQQEASSRTTNTAHHPTTVREEGNCQTTARIWGCRSCAYYRRKGGKRVDGSIWCPNSLRGSIMVSECKIPLDAMSIE